MPSFLVRDQHGRTRPVHLDAEPMSCGCDGTLEEWIDHEAGESVTLVRRLHRHSSIGTTTVRVIERDQRYGGPEEGGWYYNVEYTCRSFVVPNAKVARLRARLEKMGYEAATYPEERREPAHYC